MSGVENYTAEGICMREDMLEKRIAQLEAALRHINAINDHPGGFNREIQDVLDTVIDTSDVKF